MGWIDIILGSADSLLRSAMGMGPRVLIVQNSDKIKPGVGFKLPFSAQLQKQLKDKSETNDKNRESRLTIPRGSRASNQMRFPDRIPTFEERYEVLESSKSVDNLFLSLEQRLFEGCDRISSEARYERRGRIILREIGTTSEGRRFMFFKPFNDFGWLIERSGPGWRINRAEKIVNQNMFLRGQADAWDIVMVYHDPIGEGSIRLKSKKFGNALMSISVYEQKMEEQFLAELRGRN